MSHVRRVLMVLTNHGQVEDTEEKTGWYLPECTHPYAAFKEVGMIIISISILKIIFLVGWISY
jgi:hypothetical protein